ncbi:CheR family methyltransferase [Aquisalimonas sp.]|uniref:CheR family methyltransferase n=1 Tax=Aquisalimonas sp. TaxID=1872621 RepID=UPI0025BD93B9|nr:CheR family methyltransferase [Aquisalimonas sp.]
MTAAAFGSHRTSGLPAMDDEEFGRWIALVERRTGMTMPAERKSFLVTNVGLRMREVGFEDYESYYQHVISGVAGNLEWAALVDRLTVHETRFFRDPKAVGYLVDQVLPALARDNARELNVWSVGCSTGEEVYTLAMAITDALKRQERPPHFGVTGTDISLHALGVARQGEYPIRRLRDIPETKRLAYCEVLPDGERFRIAPALRRRVCFAHMNVLDVLPASSRQVDVIFCQNLLIYFDRARRQAIVEGLAGHLHPGGILLLGAGEFVRECPEGIERAPDAGQVLAFRRRTP